MTLKEILQSLTKVDGRRKISKDIFSETSLQRIEKDGYVISMYQSFKDVDVNKVINMTMKKLQRYQVEKFHVAGQDDRPVSMENVISSCRKDRFLNKLVLSIFFTVPF